MEVDANTLYRAIMAYDTRIVSRDPNIVGYPRPALTDMFEVTVEGRAEVYRRTLQDAWDWANWKAGCIPREGSKYRKK